MKRLFRVAGYPAVLVFLCAGIAAAVLAFGSLRLLTSGLSLMRMVQEQGWPVLTEEGWPQPLRVAGFGVLALSAYLVFRICETELVARYRDWQDR